MAGPSPSAEGRAACLAEDIPCIQCEYNLRGLMPGGRCPECGGEIALSLAEHARWKDFSSLLGPIRKGLWLLVVSQAVWLVGVPLLVWFNARGSGQRLLLAALFVSGNRPWAMAGSLGLPSIPMLLAVSFGVPCLLLQCWGSWLVTTAALPEERFCLRQKTRRLIRWGLLAGPALLIVFGLMLLLKMQWRGGWEMGMGLLLLIDLPLPLLMVWRFGQIARRLGRGALAWKIVVCGCGITGANLLCSVHVARYLLWGYTQKTYLCLAAGIFGLAIFNLGWLAVLAMLARAMAPRAAQAEAAPLIPGH